MTIQEKLAKIQTDFKAKKTRRNSFGNYNFRSAEDILEAVKPYLKTIGCTVVITEEFIEFDNTPYVAFDDKGKQVLRPTGVPIIKSTATIYDDKKVESISATAIVGVDLQQKGMQTPQAFGAASSYGKKYALGNLLLIDDTADADSTNTHGKSPNDRKVAEKPVLKGEALKKAKAAIKAGDFTIKQVQAKYKISPAILKTLK